MRRRDFIAWLGSSAATWPLPVTAHAQHASKSYRVGLIAQALLSRKWSVLTRSTAPRSGDDGT